MILSFIVTLIFFVLFTLILTYTKLSENLIPLIDSIILIISISLGAIKMSINTSKRGFLNGGVVGLVYIVILIIFSMIFMKDFQFSTYTLTKLIIGLVTGILAGMIGVNLK
nr:TIGR04086 family membrane protein [Anaeromonas frigoriresistens]